VFGMKLSGKCRTIRINAITILVNKGDRFFNNFCNRYHLRHNSSARGQLISIISINPNIPNILVLIS